MAQPNPVGPVSRPTAEPSVRPAPAGSLLAGVTKEDGAWSATLALDPEDPYYCDHPLDHVPGMALVGGLLDLLRAAGLAHADRRSRWRLALAMPSFCEPDEPVRLRVEPSDGAGPVTLGVSQDDRVVCEGTVTVSAALPPPAVPPGPRALPPPAPAELVHREQEENVMVSEVVGDGEEPRAAAVLPPATTHRLSREPGAPVPVEAVIEAARQFTEMISHLEHDVSQDDCFVLLELRAELPGELRPDVYLRWQPTPPPSGRTSLDLDVMSGDPDAEAAGYVRMTYAAVAPRVYDRLRGAGR